MLHPGCGDSIQLPPHGDRSDPDDLDGCAPTDFRALQALTDELAQNVLDRVAPKELLFDDDTARQYYADPQAALAPWLL